MADSTNASQSLFQKPGDRIEQTGSSTSTSSSPDTTFLDTMGRDEAFLVGRPWVKFLPALLVWPIWLFTMVNGSLFDEVFQYWPISIAMVFGSFIAGSTPLGGGVVAFPVSVLVLEFTSEESRDASVLVQSVGMTAASFLLLSTKRELLDAALICKSIFWGNLGMLFGIAIAAPPSLMNLIYTTLVFEFGIIYFYTNRVVIASPHSARDLPAVGPLGNGREREIATECLLALTGFIGGFVTSNVGSGSDIFLYAFGIFIWNVLYPEQRMEDNKFTASSVIVMATMSVATALTRALSGGINDRVFLAWGAMAFVVCVGAPVGSLILTPEATPYLRMLFYFLAVMQFILFGILKIKDDIAAWIAIASITVAVIGLLTLHYKKVVLPRIQRHKMHSYSRSTPAKQEVEVENENISMQQQSESFQTSVV